MSNLNETIKLSGIPQGFDALVLSDLARKNGTHVHIATDEMKVARIKEAVSIFAPDLEVLVFPAYDTVPYDRVSPRPDIVGLRIDTLTKLIAPSNSKVSRLILASAAAVMQRVPEKSFFTDTSLTLNEGQNIGFDTLKSFLTKNSYKHTTTVMETGEYAVRGGIIDLFPAGFDNPLRVDFFGDEIDSIKTFDAITQRSSSSIKSFTIKPMAEFALNDESISLFRSRYRELFGNVRDDVFYTAVSEGRYTQGIEHFLPLFHERMVPFFEYVQGVPISLDFQMAGAFEARAEQIQEYYQARLEAINQGFSTTSIYHPIPPELFFLKHDEISAFIYEHKNFSFSPFVEPSTQDMQGRPGHNFVEGRLREDQDVFDTVADFIRQSSKKVIISAATHGAGARLSGLLRDKGITLHEADSFKHALSKSPALISAPFEKGFAGSDFIVITETDILGDRIIRTPKKKKNANFITDITTLSAGDLVVHQTHGIGRFERLETLNVDGAAHDCLLVVYDGGDKLFVPVENLEVLSRYGSENASLDKLGSQSFSNRKERVKKDLFAMAEQLLAIASTRELKKMPKILPPHGAYQEFCARFPYVETDDQLKTIADVEQDLSRGKPMDRLVCGDVGFGKTEVALRAAFLAAMNGEQVAVIASTTLLARQHAQNFMERFKGFPIRIGSLSRLVSASKAKIVKEELEKGTLDIVIGTHAILSKSIKFKNLGLVIVDEEQHFGVTHKERLKELKTGVHVLTLTATPIPRTLQLSLSGVRDLSIIATPPVDRLAVKTFISPFDGVIVKEAILREHFRGGQTFFVCPRISDMFEVEDALKKLVPDIRVVKAHGQMAAAQLEKIMVDFAERKFDVLLATSIIESGLDMPSVNTIIVYRSDRFGLAALYQLRGRVGRGKLRAYAYYTTPPNKKLSETAQKRLNVMQSLDSLGAGFMLASHDLDIRGAGNLLGDEQSGHIKEIGVALYQKMLADAVRRLRAEQSGEKTSDNEDFSPQISVGLPVLIPPEYVADLDVRMNLYNRIGDIETLEEIESLRAELVDRFGAYPIEVDNLLSTVELKLLAKRANIERIDAGPKGASIAFYKNTFPNPAALIEYMSKQLGTMKIRPDQKLIVMRPWDKPTDRLAGVKKIIQKIADLA